LLKKEKLQLKLCSSSSGGSCSDQAEQYLQAAVARRRGHSATATATPPLANGAVQMYFFFPLAISLLCSGAAS
jgi:hypothetical protein